MSSQEIASLVNRYVEEILNNGRFELLGEFFATGYQRFLSPTAPPLTPEAQQQRLAGLRTAFPDLHLTVEDIIVEGDRVAFRGVLRGTHHGLFLGVPPTGKQVTAAAFDILQIEKGKIVAHWGGPDLLSILQQLGAAVSVPSK